LKRWEPRISVEAVDVAAAANAGDEAIATIAYRLVATGDSVTVAVSIPVAAG
jgi:phage baseplate assembly protein W